MSRSIHRKPFEPSKDRPGDIWQYQGCTRKRAFENERVARVFMDQNPDLLLKPYACRYCDKWHLATVQPASLPEEIALLEAELKC